MKFPPDIKKKFLEEIQRQGDQGVPMNWRYMKGILINKIICIYKIIGVAIGMLFDVNFSYLIGKGPTQVF